MPCRIGRFHTEFALEAPQSIDLGAPETAYDMSLPLKLILPTSETSLPRAKIPLEHVL